MEYTCQALYRKEVAADLADAEVISPEHIADRLGRAIQLLGDVLHRPLHEFLAHNVYLRFSPSPVVHLSLDPVLDNEAPACLLGSASVALKPNHELRELVRRVDHHLRTR